MQLSVIIATRNKLGTARLLGERVLELLPTLDVEIVVVGPFGADASVSDNKLVRYVVDEGRGAYAAYARGLSVAVGEYVWILGDDDYPLDSLARICEFVRERSADVLVAPVLLSSGRIHRPTKSLLFLLYFNWCQQGIVYRRRVLLQQRFFRRLAVQADQYVNVLLRADPSVRFVYLSDPICVFGVNGLSGRMHDTAYESIRTALARRTLGGAGFMAYKGLELLRLLAGRKGN
jgi:glycosyltransferase involved in cell wall biosynthesis